MAELEVHSFDIFDTAVTRLVIHPDHLHWGIARRLRQQGLISMDDNAWRDKRITAEAMVRLDNAESEVTLSEIYDCLAQWQRWDSNQRKRAAELEWQCELEVIRPILPVRQMVEQVITRLGRCIFISDTYFDGDGIATILSRCGYKLNKNQIFVSSEARKTKTRGDLFPHVAKSVGISCSDLTHLGDNARSDVRNAQRSGAKGHHFKGGVPNVYESRLFYGAAGGYIGSVIAGAARAARLSIVADDSKATIWTIGASVAGPILTAFVLWILIEARANKVRQIYFLARDGQILAQIATKIVAWAGWDINCRYLLGSRQAFFLASLPGKPEKALAAVLASGMGKSVMEILSEIEISDDEAAAVLRDAKLSSSVTLKADSIEIERLGEALRTPARMETFTALLARRKAGLIQYLEREEFFHQKMPAIVDLGWYGNLQRRLERVTTNRLPDGILGYYFDRFEIPRDLVGPVFTFGRMTPGYADLLESFCMADHTSIRGFDLGDCGMVFPLQLKPDTQALLWGVAEQQKAILSFTENLLAALDHTFYSPGEILAALREGARNAFDQFRYWPGAKEAETYGTILHAGDQTHLRTREIAPKCTSIMLIQLLLSNPTRRGQITTWMAGVVMRSSRTVVGAFLCLYLRYKIWRHLGIVKRPA